MRSALLCVFFALLVQRGSRADDDFKPMPIPVGDWHYEQREGRAGDVVPLPAPPHYWEDALRHSVYLTLVRDKIDQLIAKGEYISANTKPDQLASNEDDDHDLWEKTKTAPFERLQTEEPPLAGDYAVMAKGRLIEESDGFRFVEDERTREKCTDAKCSQGVKAFWTVKRVKQRDLEISPSAYHYELTFSVTSKTPKKQRKPYENSIRTFTVRESTPEKVTDTPQEHRVSDRPTAQPMRASRSIWFHRNLANPSAQNRKHNVVDRLFLSLFSREDDAEQDNHQRFRIPPQNHQIPHPGYAQFPKAGYVGSPSDQQKRLHPYPQKPYTYKYVRPPLQAPPVTHAQYNFDKEVFGPMHLPDHRYQAMKATRPAVLPTPVPQVPPPKNWTSVDNKIQNITDIPSKFPDVITGYNKYITKPKQTPIKINYLPDHVRPPVYNAPPGVFVTMDKKPFKPMPPIKLSYSSKPIKSHKPVDFRPSPQILDMQTFSEPDAHKETAFRPMTPWKYTDKNATEKIEAAESSSPVNNTRKSQNKVKKPPRKHENIQTQKNTTSAPEIITASNTEDSEEQSMQWAGIMDAFTNTKPITPQKEKLEHNTSPITPSTSSTTSIPLSPATPKRKRTTTTTEAPEDEYEEELVTTTQKPIKRTRPPPKFTKTSEKIKKHKRITAATSTTTTTTSTTKVPEVKITQDLTPQATSAAEPRPNSWNPTNKTESIATTTTTTKKPTTTTKQTTITTPIPPAIMNSTQTNDVNATQTKIKNRFRQSTLLTKGTSVNHDKWSYSTSPANVEKPKHPISSGKFPPRRKGSNFHGYMSNKKQQTRQDDKDYEDLSYKPKPITEAYKGTTAQIYENTADQYETNGEPYDYLNQDEENEETIRQNSEHESSDHTEYIFQSTPLKPQENEIIDSDYTITAQTVTPMFATPKNKTKCKKKKSSTTTEETIDESSITSTTTTTTTQKPTTTTLTIFEELFGAFTESTSEIPFNLKYEKEDIEESEEIVNNHSTQAGLDDDLQDFLDSINKNDESLEEDDDYDEDEISDSLSEVESSSSYEKNDKDLPLDRENFDRSLRLLELITLE